MQSVFCNVQKDAGFSPVAFCLENGAINTSIYTISAIVGDLAELSKHSFDQNTGRFVYIGKIKLQFKGRYACTYSVKQILVHTDNKTHTGRLFVYTGAAVVNQSFYSFLIKGSYFYGKSVQVTIGSDYSASTPTGCLLESNIQKNRSVCEIDGHRWKKYVGFTDSYRYCETCDKKETT